jgi:membrane-associated phospholipid phosphatase
MRKFYKLISIVFQPLLMPTMGMLLLLNMHVFDMLSITWRVVALLGTFIFTAVMPALPILLMLKRGEVKDVFISKREERTVPYLFSFISYFFWTLFLWKTLQLPLFMVAMGIGVSISILAITIINFKWKISAHLSGIGGLAGGIFGISYRMAYNPVWLFVIVLAISALVAISRIELKAHTPGQALAGFSLAFVSVFLPCIFF